MILSPFDYEKPSQATRVHCAQRNRFILECTSERYVPHIAKGSSLAADLENHLL